MVSQQVLPGQHVDPWKVTDLLVEMHFHKGIGFDHGVDPEHIPVTPFATVLNPPLQFLGYVSNNIVMCHYILAICTAQIQHDLLVFGVDFEWGLADDRGLAGSVRLRALRMLRLL